MDWKVIEGLIATGEGSEVEFKVRPPGHFKLARLISAFANTRGGTIIFGVEDDGTLFGVEAPHEVELALQRALELIQPPPCLRVRTLEANGVRVVICEVTRGRDKPYRVESPQGPARTYVRAGSAVHPLSGREARLVADEDLLRGRMELDELHTALLKEIASPGGVTLEQLAHRHNLSQRRVARMVSRLVHTGRVVRVGSGRGARYVVR